MSLSYIVHLFWSHILFNLLSLVLDDSNRTEKGQKHGAWLLVS